MSRSVEGPSGADPITLVGLVFETTAGLRRLTGTRIERAYALPPQSFDVLVRLARSPARRLRMSDLAAQTALTPSGLTRAIDRLESSGLVRRVACDDDRRGAFASLTRDGTSRMNTVLACHRDDVESLLAGTLTATELETLVSLLRKLRDLVNPGASRVSEL